MKRYAFPLTIILLLFAVIALAAPGDKRPAVTSAAIGLGTSSSPTLASITATTSVTAPAFTSSAADGYHYIMPYNSIAFAGTPLVGMIQTTPTGPQWYTGSAWEAIGSGGDSLPTQTGNSGKYLTTNGTAASWGTIAAGSGIAISTAIPTDAGAANLNDSTHVLTVASSTGYTQFTGSFTAWDTTPDAFSFTDETDVAADGGQSCGAAITVGGTNYPTTISATGDTGFGYKINGGTFTSASGTYAPNDTVTPCVDRSNSPSTATTATITIGGVSDTYSVTTAAGVSYTYPGTFGATDFTTPTGNNPSSVAVSSAITATTSGNISEIGVYLTGVAATECKIALFNGSSGTSSALTAGQTFSPATGWNDVAITPYSINNGTTIQAAMECNGTFNAGKNTSQSLGRYASALTYSNFPVTTTFFNVDGTNTNGFRIKVQQ